MKIPTLQEAKAFLAEAQERQPGSWVQHSIFVAQAAEAIATHHLSLDPANSSILGYVHDIGRREGVTDMRHILDGYNFLQKKGFDDAARICLTHSFPIKDINVASGRWDGSDEELQFVKEYLAQIEYTAYDRLLQLCDALALSSGFCLIEKRLVDVALRRGINDYTIVKWKAILDLQREFEKVIGESIYHILPGVIENTFGFDPAKAQVQ